MSSVDDDGGRRLDMSLPPNLTKTFQTRANHSTMPAPSFSNFCGNCSFQLHYNGRSCAVCAVRVQLHYNGRACAVRAVRAIHALCRQVVYIAVTAKSASDDLRANIR